MYACDGDRSRLLAALTALQGPVAGLAMSAQSRRVLASSSDARATLVLLDLPR